MGMRRRGGRLLGLGLAAVCVAGAAWWAVLAVRLRDGVTVFLAQERAAGVRLETASPRIAWRALPTVELGTATAGVGGVAMRLSDVRVALPPWDPSRLDFFAARAWAGTGAGRPDLTAGAIHGHVSLTDGALEAAAAGVALGGPPVDATLTARPGAAPGAYDWILGTAAGDRLLSGFSAHGTADAAAVVLAGAGLERSPGVSAEGRLTLDAAGRPVGAGTLHATSAEAALEALRPVLAASPQAARTMRTLAGVAGAFTVGDIALPVALRDGIVTVLGVPVGRLSLPPMSEAGAQGRPVPE